MWLYVPGTHLASAPASVPSTSHWNWLFQELSQHVSWRGKLQQSKYWSRAWKKGHFPWLRSTLTCSGSTASRGVESYITSLRVCLASHTPLPVRNSDTTMSEPSGQPSSEWWERCSQKWYSSKTSLHFFDTSDPLETSYNAWATSLRSRCSSQRQSAELRIGENDSLQWPTARAEDSESCGNHPDATDSLTGATRHWLTPHGMNGQDHTGKQGRGGEFAKQVTNWPTPNAKTAEDSQTHRSGARSDELLLTGMAQQWQTPATDSFRSRGGERVDEMGLDQQARFWRTPEHWGTPTSRDWKDGSSADADCPTNGLLGRQVIRNWPTPDANVMNDGESAETWHARAELLKEKGYNGNGAGIPLAVACLSSLPDPVPLTSGARCWCGIPGCDLQAHKRKLSPLFGEWLQGIPIGWTSKTARIGSEVLETWFVRCRQALQLLCSPEERG